MAPAGRALVEGYRKDVLAGFEKEKPRYNPVGRLRPLGSVRRALFVVFASGLILASSTRIGRKAPPSSI
jgi:hypothetical protein